jgi:hypothetical protein
MRPFFVMLLTGFLVVSGFAGGRREEVTSPPVGTQPGEASRSSSVTNAGEPQSGDAAQVVPLLEDGEFRSFPLFETDFSRTTIVDSDVLEGGPPKDGIPAIDAPRFVPVQSADRWLSSQEPVFAVSADGVTHLYPVQILTYHEIVNDVVGQTPVSVTFCPLCNTGITFKRDFDGRILDFGTTGRLRFSNLLMYDRQTESWWQQATGAGVVGEYAGYQLELYPMLMIPWEIAAERYPDARVLSRETGYSRDYGTNPYVGYDTGTPFLYRGPRTPGELNPMARVLQIVVNDERLAVPYPVVSEQLFVQASVGGESVVVFWEPGTASALDTREIASGRDVGTANAFLARHDGRELTFERHGDEIRDQQTGSRWSASGAARSGDLTGVLLEPVVAIQHFWFSYSAFALDERWSEQE